VAVRREPASSDAAPQLVLSPDLLLTVAVEAPEPDVRVVRPRGEIDLATAPLLRDALHAALQDELRLVAVDLDEVAFLGAHGLDALLDGHRAATARGVGFVLAGGHRPARRVLALTGLSGVLPLAESVEQALAR